MGLIERIKNAIRTNLSELSDRVDEPDARLEHFIKRTEQDLADARVELGAVVHQEERVRQEREGLLAEVEDMRERAREALAGNDEALAREALRRSERARERADRLTGEVELQSKASAVVREHVLALERKLEEARERLDLVVARRRLAEAQRLINERATRAEDELSQVLQERIDHLDASTQATTEILSAERGMLAAEEERIDALLAELRNETEPRTQPGGGD